MTGFDDREKAFENKFAHDEEMQFKAMARRNKLLGIWVADELLHKEDDEVEAYAKEVVMADFEEAGDEDVFRKVRADAPENVSDEEIRAKMIELLVQAKAELVG